MEIHVYKVSTKWTFDIVAKNKATIASGMQLYASRRNAVSAAKLIAGSKLKVVVKA